MNDGLCKIHKILEVCSYRAVHEMRIMELPSKNGDFGAGDVLSVEGNNKEPEM